MARRKFKKLTAEQRRELYKESESNAGAGWHSTSRDPLREEYGREEEVMDPRDHDFNDE